jgi:hypothetical protein
MSTSTSTAWELGPWGRPLLIVNAAVAWCAVMVSLVLTISGYYVDDIDPAKPTILGNVPDGIDTPLERFFDWITYFTIISNITVAVVVTLLLARPDLFTRRGLVGDLWRALRLDSVLMIVITGVVYNLLLAEGGKEGWDAISNTLLHWVVPLLTPIVWIIAGPRGLISSRTIPLALVLPLAWAAFALIRGEVVGAYPYPFLDVRVNGWASVLTFIAVIVVVAVIVALLLWAVDVALRWTMRKGSPAEAGNAAD